MSLSTHDSETSFSPSLLGGTFAHFADAERESSSRVVTGMEQSNIDYSLYSFRMNAILNSSMKPNDAFLSHEWNAVEWENSSAGLPYHIIQRAHFGLWPHRLSSTGSLSVLKYGESSASALVAKETPLVAQIYQAMRDNLNEFLRYSPPTELASFEELMDALQMMGFNESAARLAYLRSTEDMEEGDAPLSLESARGFVEFMNGFPDLGEPLLGLFSGGTLSAGWRIADDKHLLVEPLDGENASFALIGPSQLPGEKFRLNGKGSIAEIIHTLRDHGVDKWSDA